MANDRARHWWDKWDWPAWFADQGIERLQPASVGIWVNAIGKMFLDGKCGQISGTVEELAAICRAKSEANMAAAILDLYRTETAEIEFNWPCGKAVENLRISCGQKSVTVTNVGGALRSALQSALTVTVTNRRMHRAWNKNSTTASKQRRYRRRKELEKMGLDVPPDFERR